MDPQQLASLVGMLKNPNTSIIPPAANVSSGAPTADPNNSVPNGTPMVDPNTGMLSSGMAPGMLGANPYAGQGMLG